MYGATLALHSWLRWAAIIFGLTAGVRAAAAAGSGHWSRADDRAALLFTVVLDVQVLVGLALYFALSPTTTASLHHFGAAMQTSAERYWAVEHEAGMILALALAHVGRARVRRLADARKGRTAAILFAIALVVMVASIPWPGMLNGRPWLRLP